MSKIYLSPTGLYSRAMLRVANALRESLPPNFEEVKSTKDLGKGDVQVLHVISRDAIPYAQRVRRRGVRYIVVQYCLLTAGFNWTTYNDWFGLWNDAELVWSYYDLAGRVLPQFDYEPVDFNCRFYHAPLGIDQAFAQCQPQPKQNYILTTGYVSGPGAEAITDVWQAAKLAGITRAVHIGPKQSPEPLPVQYHTNISDHYLALLYAQTKYVCSMRYVEGFEMPAVEGLACYTRPIVFDQPDMRHWYDGLALFVPDGLHWQGLIDYLAGLFTVSSRGQVTRDEHDSALSRFNWQIIMQGFWERISHVQ